MQDDFIKDLTLWLSMITEAAAALVIAVGILEAMGRTLVLLVRDIANGNATVALELKEDVRLRLGRWLALALEFLLAADILRTAVAPSWSEIGQLAAIAAIRTALNFFLQQEIDKAEVRRDQAARELSSPAPP